jgi:hypothetical protein
MHISEAYVAMQLMIIIIVVIISIWRAIHIATLEIYDVTQTAGKRMDRILWGKK